MKAYTQEEFNALPVDEYGIKHCPSGDYTAIKSFGERCSFGEGCSFGDWCSFGERCSFGEGCSFETLTNARYIAVDRIGHEQRKAYFFAADEGYYVRAGCWFGTFDAFEKRVKEIHSGTKHERDYLAALELAKVMLEYEN